DTLEPSDEWRASGSYSSHSLVSSCYLATVFRPRFDRAFCKKNCGAMMAIGNVHLGSHTRQADFRLCNVSGYMTELLEIEAENPKFHVLFIPGNPGRFDDYSILCPICAIPVHSIVEVKVWKKICRYCDLLQGFCGIIVWATWWKCVNYRQSVADSAFSFTSSYFEIVFTCTQASIFKGFSFVFVSAIGHISHTSKDWEQGRLFSLEEQIIHKMDFIDHKLQSKAVPIILVIYCIGLYPFLAVDMQSAKQTTIRKITESPILSLMVSLLAAALALLPNQQLRLIIKKSLGKSWSVTAIEAGCTHLLKYHTIRNMLFMARTEFAKLSETPDWDFMRAKVEKIAFVFGEDDHWGPLSMLEKISKQVPGVSLSIEREGHMHAFSCSEAGSLWAAQRVASLIKEHASN
ncbi:Lipid droplet-associated hydrolase-like protein, partial [Drosera capensis]